MKIKLGTGSGLLLPATFLLFFGYPVFAQKTNRQEKININSPIEGGNLTLNDCIGYALKNQPALNQVLIDRSVSNLNRKIAVSAWMPQVSGSMLYQNYLSLPYSFSTVGGKLTGIGSGVFNYGLPQIGVAQTLFSHDALLAGKVADLGKEAAATNVTALKINLIASVSKAFYDLLLSVKQVEVYREDTARLAKNMTDAYHRFVSGVSDKVDYKQASIALNNSLAGLKSELEIEEAKKAVLKELIGAKGDVDLRPAFDTAALLNQIYVDTLAAVHMEKRIEYSQLQIARRLQHENSLYYKYGYLPSIGAYYNYVYEWEGERLSTMFQNAYPYSVFGVQLNIPIFTGLKRVDNYRKSILMEKRTDLDVDNLELAVNTQYSAAMANYKASLYNLHIQLENRATAQEVYNIVKFQYREGIKSYLDVVIAESDLKTSEINYLNALFKVLESKVDLQVAMGDIQTEI